MNKLHVKHKTFRIPKRHRTVRLRQLNAAEEALYDFNNNADIKNTVSGCIRNEPMLWEERNT